MARIGDNVLPSGVELSVTLDRYQELMRLPESAFNGLNRPLELPNYNCNAIWKQRDRDYLAIFLAHAQEKREQELGYHIAPLYSEEEEFPWDLPILLPAPAKQLKLIGKRVVTDLALAQALSHGIETNPNDPVSFTLTVGFTDATEIKIFYPDEDVEIHPSNVSISGTTATIEIPRARLVLNSLNDNREDHLDYFVNANFLTTVDVKRHSYDIPTGVVLVWKDRDGDDVTQVARPIIDDLRLAIVSNIPASYNSTDEVWTGAAYKIVVGSTALPTIIRMSYIAGRESNLSVELDTCRLTHTLMPHQAVDCEAIAQYWLSDRLPDPSRIVTPYGSTAGAVSTWIADSRAKIGIGGKF